MKKHLFSRQLPGILLLILPLLLLSGCDRFPFFHSKQPPAPSNSTQAEGYVSAQAQATLALQQKPENKKLIKSHAKKLNTYSGAKKKAGNKETVLSVLALEYTLDGGSETQTVLVPVEITQQMPSFRSLSAVQKQLSGMPYTLHNIHLYYVTLDTSPTQKFSDEPSALRNQLQAEQQSMLEAAAPLLPYDHTRLQLQLAEFFLKARVRDAAYLTLENAKASLALLADNASDENITALSQKADALASRLNKEMPYKL